MKGDDEIIDIIEEEFREQVKTNDPIIDFTKAKDRIKALFAKRENQLVEELALVYDRIETFLENEGIK